MDSSSNSLSNIIGTNMCGMCNKSLDNKTINCTLKCDHTFHLKCLFEFYDQQSNILCTAECPTCSLSTELDDQVEVRTEEFTLSTSNNYERSDNSSEMKHRKLERKKRINTIPNNLTYVVDDEAENDNSTTPILRRRVSFQESDYFTPVHVPLSLSNDSFTSPVRFQIGSNEIPPPPRKVNRVIRRHGISHVLIF